MRQLDLIHCSIAIVLFTFTSLLSTLAHADPAAEMSMYKGPKEWWNKIHAMSVDDLLSTIQTNSDPEVRSLAISSFFGKKGNDPRIGPAIITFLDSTYDKERYRTIQVLGSGYHPYLQAKDKIFSILKFDPNSAVRDEALKALSNLGGIPKEEAIKINEKAQSKDICGEISTLFTTVGSSPDYSIQKLTQLYTNYLESNAKESSRDVCLFGFAYQLKGIRDEQLIPLREIFKKLARTNLSSGARINLTVDLGNLARNDSEMMPILCEQLKFGDHSLRIFVSAALAKIGKTLNDCGPIQATYSASNPEILNCEDDGAGLELHPFNEKKEPGTDPESLPLYIRAKLSKNNLLRVEFECQSNRTPLFSWFCKNCKDSDLSSGKNMFPETPRFHRIHAKEPGTYLIKVSCSGKEVTNYNQGTKVELNVPK